MGSIVIGELSVSPRGLTLLSCLSCCIKSFSLEQKLPEGCAYVLVIFLLIEINETPSTSPNTFGMEQRVNYPVYREH